MQDTTTDTTPKVYCGTYEKYNNGSIAGAWLDLSDYSDAAEFWQACKELHKDERDPEYMFQDFEGFPQNEYSESGLDFDKLIEYAQFSDSEREVIDAYIDATGYKMADIELDEVQEKVIFTEDSSDFSNLATQFGYSMAEDTGEVPDNLSAYFNYEQYGNDWLANYLVADGYVFSND